MRPIPLLAALALPMGQGQLGTPPGFTAELVAEAPELRWPSALLALDDGSLLVAEDPMGAIGPDDQPIDRILRLVFRSDGAHRTEVFAEGLFAVFGLEQVDDSVLVVNTPHLTRLRDADGDGRAEEREVLVQGLGPRSPGARSGFNDHAASGLRLGIDGYLYISVGDRGIPRAVGGDGSEITLRGGGIVRVRPDGTRLEVVATGTRNHLDLAIDERGEMFTYDNADDGLGWWTRVTHIVVGGYYGYPWDWRDHPERTLPCMADFGSGAPTGGLVYREAAWPVRYRGSLFWCEWDKQALCRIEVEPDGATFRVFSDQDFVTAGTVADFRPTDVCESPDGRFLYVADWAHPDRKDEQVTGRLWRLRRANDSRRVVSRARALPSTPVELIDALGDSSFRHRLRAQRAIVRGRDERSIELLLRALDNPSEARRRHAIWALVGSGDERVRLALLSALAHPDVDTQVQAVRAFALHGRRPHDELVRLLRRGEPRVRREAAHALGRVGGAEEAARLAAALQLEGDPTVRWSIRGALRRIGVWDEGVVNWVNIDSDPDLLEALRGVYDMEAVRRLALFVSGLEQGLPEEWTERLASERAHAVSVLADVHRKPEPWDGSWWGPQPALGAPPAKINGWEGSRLVVTTVRNALDDPVASVRGAALEALRVMPDPQGPAGVRELFERETDPDNLLLILEVLAAVEDVEAAALFESVLRDTARPPELRVAAVRAVGVMAAGGAPAMVELLRAAATSEELPFEALALALAALAEIGDEPSVPIAEARLDHRSPTVRTAAVRALTLLAGERAVAELPPLLEDRSSEVRLVVIAALGELEAAEAVPALLERLDQPGEGEAVVRALTHTPDARALDAYLRGLADPSTREACRAALLRIRADVRATIEQRYEAEELEAALVDELRAILGGPRPLLEWTVLGPYERGRVQPAFAGGAVSFQLDGAPLDPARARAERVEHRADPVHGRVDLARLLSPEPNLEAFAWSEIEAEVAREVELLVGGDDSLSIWVNGELVHDCGEPRAEAADQERVYARLDPGINTLLVRVGRGSREWSFGVSLPGDRTGPLFEQGPPPPPPEVEEHRAFALANEGDSSRGYLLFRDERRVSCIRCHTFASGRGRLGDRVGPDLDGVSARLEQRDLITSVLEPSRHLADGYRATKILTVDGARIFGQVTREDRSRVVLVGPDGERLEVRVADIADREQSELSVMPGGLHELISPEELADLIAFLETLGGGRAEPVDDRRR